MLPANKVAVDEAARVTGLRPDDIRKATNWIAEPKRAAAYEKGLIWSSDNYQTNGALVNIAVTTGNLGGGCVRMGGHQEGYVRSLRRVYRKAGSLSRSAAGRRQGRHPSHLGVQSLQDDAQCDGVPPRLQETHRSGEVRDERHRLRRS